MGQLSVRRALFSVTALFAAAFAGVVGGPLLPMSVPAAHAAAPVVPCPPGSEWQLRDLVNAFRAANGKAAVPMSAELNAKAQAWSDNMAASNRLYHSSLSSGVSAGWSSIGENVAYNYSVANAQTALQNSPPHKVNLLGAWTEMGLGISEGANGTIWVTEVFVNRAVPTGAYTGPANTSAFTPVTPTVVHEPPGLVAAGTTSTFQLTGLAGVPAGATSAVVTIEASDATARGYVQGLGPGSTVGATSNLNLVDGRAANTAVIPLSPSGQLSLYNSVAAHLRISVVGYFSPAGGPVSAGRLTALTPARLLDTRPTLAVAYTGAKPVAQQTVLVQVTGRGGVPSTGVRAAVLNVVATQTEGLGQVQVGAGGMAVGAWRNLLVGRANQTIANLVIVPLDANGRAAVNVTVGMHLVVDVQGWFTSSTAAPSTAGLFVPIVPGRFLDTRSTAAAAGMKNVDVPKRFNVPACPRAALGNLTIIPTGLITYGQAGPWGQFTAGAFSSLNGDTAMAPMANAALVRTGSGYDLGVYSPQPAHIIVDLAGWFV